MVMFSPDENKYLQRPSEGNNCHLEANVEENDQQLKYYINNPSSLIKNAVGSGGVH